MLASPWMGGGHQGSLAVAVPPRLPARVPCSLRWPCPPGTSGARVGARTLHHPPDPAPGGAPTHPAGPRAASWEARGFLDKGRRPPFSPSSPGPPPPVPWLWGRRGRSRGARGSAWGPSLRPAGQGGRPGARVGTGGRRLVPAAAGDTGGGTWDIFAVLKLSG